MPGEPCGCERRRKPGAGRETAGEIQQRSFLVPRKKSDQRRPFVDRGDELVRFQDELTRGHALDPFQSGQRMAQVIEQATTEYEVEGSKRIRAEIVRIQSLIFDLTFEEFASKKETFQPPRPLPLFIPSKGINRQNT